MKHSIKGVYTSIVTPFKEDYALDLEGVKVLIEKQIENRVHGLLVGGTNGEFCELTMEERMKLYKKSVEVGRGKIPIVLSTGLPNTKETIQLTKYAKDIGADYVMICPPFFEKSNEDGVYRHYESIAEAVDIPIILYNVPPRGHLDLNVKLLQRLTAIENIVCIKECDSAISKIVDTLNLIGDRLTVLTGNGYMTLPALAAGAKGTMSGFSAIAPKMAVDLYESFERGDSLKARAINLKLSKLMRMAGNPSELKAAMSLLGLPGGPVRLPLMPLKKDGVDKLRSILQELGLID